MRALVDAEQWHLAEGRKATIYAARDRFYRGDLGQRIATAVQNADGLMTAADHASYRGRVERPTRLTRNRATTPTNLQDDFVFPDAQDPELMYSFKHALTQDVVVYAGLLDRRRRQYHTAAALGIEELHAERLDEVMELLA